MDTTAWNSSDSIVRFRDQREHIMRDNARPALSPIWYHAATQLEKYMRIVFGVVMAGCLLSGGLLAQQSSTVQVYIVPNHGSLRLSIPASWTVQSTAMADPATIFLHIAPPMVKDFDAQLTAVWLNPDNLAKTTAESIKANTERAGNGELLQAVEKNLILQELRGAQTVGTYYSLTDRKPAPGEFKGLTQGSFLTGELLAAFTILSDSPGSSEVRQLLKMFSDATHVKTTGAATPEKP
jgi:hypothetical protein